MKAHPNGGTDLVQDGKLTGATDTDYFYFFCPKCPDKHIMRMLDYVVREERDDNPYNDKFKKKAKKGFTLAFQIYCEKCKHTDGVRLSNICWQGGTHDEVLHRGGNKD